MRGWRKGFGGTSRGGLSGNRRLRDLLWVGRREGFGGGIRGRCDNFGERGRRLRRGGRRSCRSRRDRRFECSESSSRKGLDWEGGFLGRGLRWRLER